MFGGALKPSTARGSRPPAPKPYGRVTPTRGADLIHSVTNSVAGFTAALHVYSGDFYRDDRSEWEPQTLTEQPFDMERAKRLFCRIEYEG